MVDIALVFVSVGILVLLLLIPAGVYFIRRALAVANHEGTEGDDGRRSGDHTG